MEQVPMTRRAKFAAAEHAKTRAGLAMDLERTLRNQRRRGASQHALDRHSAHARRRELTNEERHWTSEQTLAAIEHAELVRDVAACARYVETANANAEAARMARQAYEDDETVAQILAPITESDAA